MGVVPGRRPVLVAMAVGVLAVLAMAQQDQDDVVGVYQPRDPCPQVETIVQQIVADEVRQNPQITAGFLRVFFHDCFTGGCDASILLDGEWNAPPNRGSVQPRVRELVNVIRDRVNRVCGDKAVSCADILALATRDSVVAAKGPRVPISRGRFDSLTFGTNGDIPSPFDSIAKLRQTFGKFKLDKAADLVALSGGHTVGKTRFCGGVVRPDFKANCNAKGSHDLDVITPVVFDNQYFVGLNRSLGVFPTDQKLLTDDAETRNLVIAFARDQNEFFKQWTTSFKKLSDVNWVSQKTGEIRRDCARTNSGRLGSIIQDAADQ
ncbi:hypothetical protein EJB05_40297, partial [Eragrostis curvula]